MAVAAVMPADSAAIAVQTLLAFLVGSGALPGGRVSAREARAAGLDLAEWAHALVGGDELDRASIARQWPEVVDEPEALVVVVVGPADATRTRGVADAVCNDPAATPGPLAAIVAGYTPSDN